MSDRAHWLPLPGIEVPVESVPWWLYVLGALTLMVAGAALRALVLPWRGLLGGESVPRKTVDLMLTAKDAELARKDAEIARAILATDRWVAAYNLEHQAYRELAESVEDFTRAIETLNQRESSDARHSSGRAAHRQVGRGRDNESG